jgi:hypothetical protein
VSERTLLRRSRTPFGSDATFLTPNGLDVDSTQNYEVVRRRVFFDDVHLVTIHRERGIAFLVVTAALGAFLVGMAVLFVSINTDTWPVALGFFVPGFLLGLACAIRLLMGRDVITVFGRRSKAVLRFGSFQKQRARDVYGQICATIRRAQSAFPAAPPPAAPALPPDIPMPPTS